MKRITNIFVLALALPFAVSAQTTRLRFGTSSNQKRSSSCVSVGEGDNQPARHLNMHLMLPKFSNQNHPLEVCLEIPK